MARKEIVQSYEIKSDLPYLNGLKLIDYSPKVIEFSLGKKDKIRSGSVKKL